MAAIVLAALQAQVRADSVNGEVGPPGEDPPYTVDSGWTSFSWFSGPGTFNSEGPFTFVSATPVDLKVTDAFLYGDRFNVYDFGVSIGLTSVPGLSGPSGSGDPNVAYFDPGFSNGLFSLGAGAHSITFQSILIPAGFPSGGAFFRADTAAVPIPSAVWGGGLLMLCLAAARLRTEYAI